MYQVRYRGPDSTLCEVSIDRFSVKRMRSSKHTNIKSKLKQYLATGVVWFVQCFRSGAGGLTSIGRRWPGQDRQTDRHNLISNLTPFLCHWSIEIKGITNDHRGSVRTGLLVGRLGGVTLLCCLACHRQTLTHSPSTQSNFETSLIVPMVGRNQGRTKRPSRFGSYRAFGP